MADNNKKKRKKASTAAMKRMMVGGAAEVPDQEELITPMRMVVNNFLENKVAMTGLILFFAILLCCIILPFFFPIEWSFQDVTQANTAPGFKQLSVPSSLKNNAMDISVGSTYSVGLDKDGNIYEWGSFPTNKLKKLPSKEEMGTLVQVSAGLDHALALNEEGQVFTWGNDRMGLESLPMELRMGEKVKEIYAGYQVSLALTEKGKLYNWGNDYLLEIRIPKEIQGNIEKFTANTNLAMVVTTDGMVVPLTKKSSVMTRIPEEIQGRVVELAMTDESAAAVTEDGAVHVWGNNIKGTMDVPENLGKVSKIVAGRFHYTVLLEDGSVVAWGDNTFNQKEVPEITEEIADIQAGYYGNYVIGASGKVYAWGLKGYLMGTDDLGRDIFRRLLIGGRMTMTVGAIAVIISAIIGIIIGGISGYKGGKVDNLLMRLAEIVSSIPFLPFAIILSSIVGNRISETQRIMMIMVILGLLSWPGTARLVRGSVLTEREQEFVTAAKSLGVKEMGIVFRHIIPNVLTVIVVDATLGFATCMLTESSLSFIGFGVQEPNATWGNMLNGCRDTKVIADFWWRWVFPAISLGICTISINSVGDGLQDAIDPKSKER